MTGWLLETLLTVTLLMLLVLAVRQPVARIFGAGWAYALWLVPAARLFLPPLPQLFPESNLPPVVIFIPTTAEATASLPAAAGPGQWVPLMLALWAGGAVIFLTLQWLAYRAFLKRLGAHSRPARPPRYGGISTLVSALVEGPLALGLIERRIVVPSDFSRRYSPDERRLAMEHELTHHRRGDIWFNVAAMLVLALNWFNPVAWIAFRAFRADQELSCDAAVAARATPEERHDYARALVKSASSPGLIAACPLHHAEQLKRRLRMMRGHRVSRARSAGGLAALAVFALTGFSLASREQPLQEVVYVEASPSARSAIQAPAAAPAVAKLAALAPRAAPPARIRHSQKARPVVAPSPPAETVTAPSAAEPAPEPLTPAKAALARLIPQLASLAVDPAPRPAQAVEYRYRYTHRERAHDYAGRHVTQVVMFPPELTPEQRKLIKDAIRRAEEAQLAEPRHKLHFAILRTELEKGLRPSKIKIKMTNEGEASQ